MLKKENRISLNKDFDRTFRSGKSFIGKNLKIKVVDNNLEKTRLGIIISAKVSKKAVVRNKYKRLIREIIKKELANISPNKDLVIVVFKEILDKNSQEIEKELLSGLKKLKVLEKNEN
ncbi:MAG: ribonuclease P protein component [Patescibacteria group bacterium]|jgi:ribonuclease P protein component|nr:ribonuclease P protein component [bacterium]HQC50055.1 ribonuclease P protein component [bacterium]